MTETNTEDAIEGRKTRTFIKADDIQFEVFEGEIPDKTGFGGGRESEVSKFLDRLDATKPTIGTKWVIPGLPNPTSWAQRINTMERKFWVTVREDIMYVEYISAGDKRERTAAREERIAKIRAARVANGHSVSDSDLSDVDSHVDD